MVNRICTVCSVAIAVIMVLGQFQHGTAIPDQTADVTGIHSTRVAFDPNSPDHVPVSPNLFTAPPPPEDMSDLAKQILGLSDDELLAIHWKLTGVLFMSQKAKDERRWYDALARPKVLASRNPDGSFNMGYAWDDEPSVAQ